MPTNYLYLGRLVALLPLQGGPGLPVFCQPIAHYITSGKFITTNINDFPEDRRTIVQRVRQKHFISY